MISPKRRLLSASACSVGASRRRAFSKNGPDDENLFLGARPRGPRAVRNRLHAARGGDPDERGDGHGARSAEHRGAQIRCLGLRRLGRGPRRSSGDGLLPVRQRNLVGQGSHSLRQDPLRQLRRPVRAVGSPHPPPDRGRRERKDERSRRGPRGRRLPGVHGPVTNRRPGRRADEGRPGGHPGGTEPGRRRKADGPSAHHLPERHLRRGHPAGRQGAQ
jgi:hypothetical protein